jgi:molecular chaperone GrpE
MANHKEHRTKKSTGMEPLYAETPAEGYPFTEDEASISAERTAGESSVQLEQLRQELEAAIAARQRALADFANYQRRALENEARARRDGQNQIARQLVPVLDAFELALAHDPENMTAEQLASGLRIVRETLVKVMADSGMKLIEPLAGEAFNPVMHEAMLHEAAEGIAPNHVVRLYQPGYMLGETVLRPAKVSVAPEA